MANKIEKLLSQAAYFEKLAVFSDRKEFLKALAQTLPETVIESGPQMPPVVTLPETVIEGDPSKKINPAYQNMLSYLFVNEMVPLSPDGDLGAQTRKAMDMFKTKYMGGTGTDQQIFAKLKEVYDGEKLNEMTEKYWEGNPNK